MKQVVLCLSCLVCLSPVAEAEDPTPERIETVRKTYRAVPPDILGVKEPIELQWADILFDGGTIFVKAKDAAGRVFHATLQYDVSYLKLQGKSVADWADNYQTHRIQFDFHRNVNHGPYYPIRGAEEAAIYGLLIRWSENPTYEPVGEKLQNYRQQWMDLFLSAMDYRFATLPDAKMDET